MSRATRKDHKLQRRRCRTFVECLRQFLTPEVFKQAHAVGPARRASRWNLQPLVFVLLTTTWCTGDSLEERFEAARGFYVACHVKRRRPGKTMQGLQAALSKLPVAVLRKLAAGVRRQMLAQLGDRLLTWGWIVLGCDGSRVECPRAAELEARLGQAGKEHSAPCLWISALVHLRSGLLWAWRLGKGIASAIGGGNSLLSRTAGMPMKE